MTFITPPSSWFRAKILTVIFMAAVPVTASANSSSVNMPNVSAQQIAADVRVEYNNRSGERYYIAPTFDPFEQDSSMAGSVNLRSTNGVTSIEGQDLRGGAILDMSFYYNSQGQDPYDMRGFGDGVHLNGEFAPVVLRDNRVLECSQNVHKTVYNHQYYYTPRRSYSHYRPYRHYAGHFGYGWWDRPSWRRGGHGYGNGDGWRRRRPDRPDRPRRRRPDTDDSDRVPPSKRRSGPGGKWVSGDPIVYRVSPNVDSATGRPAKRKKPKGTDKRDRKTPAVVSRRRPEFEKKRPIVSRPTPAPSRPAVSRPTRKPAKVSKPRPRPEPRRPKTTRSDKPDSKISRPVSRKPVSRKRDLKKMHFFPNDYYGPYSGGRDVVTQVDVDCAREEQLSLFIPAERLDAARFDGMTVIVLDQQGGEYPVFVPPNYIEGFKLARSGQSYGQQGYQQPAPVTRSYQPHYQRDRAACPTGTTPQSDGTCLQMGNRYP